MDPVSRARAAARNQIVEGYQKVLPAVQRRLTFGGDQPVARRARIRRECTSTLNTNLSQTLICLSILLSDTEHNLFVEVKISDNLFVFILILLDRYL